MIHDIVNNEHIEIVTSHPAKIAEMLLEDEIDIGLVPLAILPKLKEAYIITKYGIGSTGNVATVCLFSQVPLEQIEYIYLDYQSRTSVNLVQILAKNFWNIDVQFLPAMQGYESKINGTTAGVIIGDRVFDLQMQYLYKYDLSEAWFNFTKKSFVFARWIANKKLSDDQIEKFEQMLTDNLATFYTTIEYLSLPIHKQQYLSKLIQYKLNEAHESGMKFFLEELAMLG